MNFLSGIEDLKRELKVHLGLCTCSHLVQVPIEDLKRELKVNPIVPLQELNPIRRSQKRIEGFIPITSPFSHFRIPKEDLKRELKDGTAVGNAYMVREAKEDLKGELKAPLIWEVLFLIWVTRISEEN